VADRLSTGEVFTDLSEYMAALVLLSDRGEITNATFGGDDDTRRFVRKVRRLNKGWRPGTIPLLARPRAPLVRQPPLTASRPRERQAGRARSTRAGPDDDPHLERRCEACGASLAGKRRHAKTCSDRCRVALHRRFRPSRALLKRYDAALAELRASWRPELPVGELLELLDAVVFPQDARLRAAA
jgi:hypothetical protein